MLDLKQTKWVIFDKDLKNIWDKGWWVPVEELANLNKHIKYYRGWKAAINGYLSGRGYGEDVRLDNIRVLPINLTINIEESYEEVPVSSYFSPKYDIKIKQLHRYIKTEKLNAIIDLLDMVKIRFGTHSEHGLDTVFAVWTEQDKYGVSREYCDTIIATSDNKDDLL